MNILGPAEKETICRKFREHGENRIADWIARQYLVTQEADEPLISQESKWSTSLAGLWWSGNVPLARFCRLGWWVFASERLQENDYGREFEIDPCR
jgi:hypothetical protein